jgi:ribonuclease HI
LTKEEAEYKALIEALDCVGQGSTVLFLMDSPTVSNQFMYPLPVSDPRLNALLSKATNLEREKWLNVAGATTISRSQNLAAELLDSRRPGRRKRKNDHRSPKPEGKTLMARESRGWFRRKKGSLVFCWISAEGRERSKV